MLLMCKIQKRSERKLVLLVQTVSDPVGGFFPIESAIDVV